MKSFCNLVRIIFHLPKSFVNRKALFAGFTQPSLLVSPILCLSKTHLFYITRITSNTDWFRYVFKLRRLFFLLRFSLCFAVHFKPPGSLRALSLILLYDSAFSKSSFIYLSILFDILISFSSQCFLKSFRIFSSIVIVICFLAILLFNIYSLF